MLSSPGILVRAEQNDTRVAGIANRCLALGFTLIELMVVVAIVAILAAIAYPSYRSQIEKTRRADAKAVLMQAAQYMERLYTENGCYDGESLWSRDAPPCRSPSHRSMVPRTITRLP